MENKGQRPTPTSPQGAAPCNVPVELRCGGCGKKGQYDVGRLCIDPDRQMNDRDEVDDAFCFTSYVRCKHCGAGGPWELTAASRLLLESLLEEAALSPRHARIHRATLTLFDGTTMRWPTEGESHLKQLIDKDPGDHYLWNRLGNLYKAGGANDLAREAFQKALERNEHDVESLHSLAEVYFERKEDEAAARYFHEFLLHARHAPERTPKKLLRSLIRHALGILGVLHQRSGGRISILPEQLESPPVPQDLKKPIKPVLTWSPINLADEESSKELVDWLLTGKFPESLPPSRAPTPAPRAQAKSGPVGRNDPCSCGSGKKYKHCCMRS